MVLYYFILWGIMPDLVALFDFEKLNPDSEDKRYGEGSIQINTEREPESEEDFLEITKAIFRRGGYAQVALKHVFYDDNDLFSRLQKPETSNDTYNLDATGPAGILDETIPGEVVDE